MSLPRVIQSVLDTRVTVRLILAVVVIGHTFSTIFLSSHLMSYEARSSMPGVEGLDSTETSHVRKPPVTRNAVTGPHHNLPVERKRGRNLDHARHGDGREAHVTHIEFTPPPEHPLHVERRQENELDNTRQGHIQEAHVTHIEFNPREDKEATAERTETETTALKSNSMEKPANHSTYAYAYAIGGCNPEIPNHRGYLFDILVSTRILRDEGSREDVVVFVQMSSKTNATALSAEETRWLTDMGVRIQYIPKSASENFVEIQLEKFRILSLTEYKRVLFMDGDVMPIGNLDYIFQLSEKGHFKENFVVSGHNEPANGGFFMLAPHEGDYERIRQITRDYDARLLANHGVFDEGIGWGHVFEEGDLWKSQHHEGTNWTFHGAAADQGLLYHWVKYEKKSFTQVRGLWVDNYGADATNKVVKESSEYRATAVDAFAKPRAEFKFICSKFLCDYVHFTSRAKPWMDQPPFDVENDSDANKTPEALFYHTLASVNSDLHMGLDFTHWQPIGRPNLGLAGNKNHLKYRVDSMQQRDKVV